MSTVLNLQQKPSVGPGNRGISGLSMWGCYSNGSWAIC